ncbi:MAG: hypothetical protein J7621_10195 [Niastella sp.]|nr:hypothetical protein [Niastella sp.]
MKKRCVGSLVFLLLSLLSVAQNKFSYSYRFGAQVAFGLSDIANNEVGIGGLAGAEKRFSRNFAVEAEGSYVYFTGDKMWYEMAKNRAFALPVLAGIKAYLSPQVYGSVRAGAAWFLLNDMNKSAVRPAYGIAAGLNIPKSTNRINIQLGWTSFRYADIQRGYGTLSTSININ